MNREIKPLTAVLIIGLFIGLLFGKFWASGEEKAVRTFSYMQTHPKGDTYIMLGHQLFGFDAQGNSTKIIDLTKLGVDESIVTDFAFFSNGDILLRKQIIKHSLNHDLQRYQRETNTDDIYTDNQEIGLFRCNLNDLTCKPFTKKPLNLSDAFALFIDWKTNRIFLSDTSHHTVYSYSEQGELLSSANNFIFPNQIIYQDNKLYVADTNHHQLAVLNITNDKITDKIETMDTRTNESRKLGEIWPSSMLLLPEQRWVINSRNGMNHGGIYIFDNQGKYLKRLEQPEGSDLFSLLQMGNSILASNYSNDTIYRYDLNGKRLANFESPVMQAALAEAVNKRYFYKKLDRVFNTMFVFLLVAGFAYGIWLQNKDKKLKPKPEKTAPIELFEQALTIDLNDSSIYWFKMITMYKVSMSFASFGLLGILILFNILFTSLLKDTPIIFLMSFYVISLVYFIAFAFALFNIKMGIKDHYVIFVQGISKPTQCHQDKIIFCGNIFILGKKFININTLKTIFGNDEIEEKLQPMIKHGIKINHNELQNLLFK